LQLEAKLSSLARADLRPDNSDILADGFYNGMSLTSAYTPTRIRSVKAMFYQQHTGRLIALLFISSHVAALLILYILRVGTRIIPLIGRNQIAFAISAAAGIACVNSRASGK